MMNAQIEKQHQWLQKFVGNWTYESESDMGPGQPPAKASGTEVGRSIGERWVVVEGSGSAPDGTSCIWMTTLGYDPQLKRFVGTWLGSMMSNLWVYDGSLDAGERILSLACDGPSFTEPGKIAKYRDEHEFVTDDHRILRGTFQAEDGTWKTFMTTHYRRTR
jgi:hypothetical protein